MPRFQFNIMLYILNKVVIIDDVVVSVDIFLFYWF